MADIDAQLSALLSEIAAADVQVREKRSKVTLARRANQVSTLRQDPVAAAMVPGARKLSAASTSQLLTARDRVVQLRRNVAAADANKQKLEARVKQVEETLTRATAEREELAAETLWDSPNARHFVTPMDRMNMETDLKRRITEQLQLRQRLQVSLDAKTIALNRTTQQLADLEDVEWELFRLRAEAEIKGQELADVNSELRSFSRILRKKGALLDRTLAVDDTTELLALEGDKRWRQKRLEHHLDQTSRNKSTSEHRALQIRQKERQLAMIGDALRDVLIDRGLFDADAEETADAAELDTVRAAIAKSQLEEEAAAKQLAFLDAQVENAETRVEILGMSTTSTAREADARALQHQHRMAQLNVDVDKQCTTARQLVEDMRRSREANLAKLNELRAAQP